MPVSDSVIHAIAGATGGMLAMTVTYPLVYVSTRAAVNTKQEKKTVLEVVTETIQKEGITGLYSGLSSSLLGIAFTNGVYYYFYERSRGSILKTRTGSQGLSTPESMLAGLIAGSATTLITNPIWVVQTAQTVRTLEPDSENPAEKHVVKKKLGLIETINHILNKDGVGAFWRGIGPALVLVINPVLQYTVFEQLKNFLIARRTNALRIAGVAATAVLSDWDFFLLGALSKFVATGSTYPYIVMKSRLQAGQSKALKYKSSVEGLLAILKEEGVAGLYRGVGSKLLQSVLTAAFLFACQHKLYMLTKQVIASTAAK